MESLIRGEIDSYPVKSVGPLLVATPAVVTRIALRAVIALGAVTAAVASSNAAPAMASTHRMPQARAPAAAAAQVTALGYDVRLTRAPYLTDLVGLNVTVNFGTDRSFGFGSVRYGTVVSGKCVLTSPSIAASRLTVAVGTQYQYQWKARLALPRTGSYCYRPFLGAVNLLAGLAAPRFRTQVPAGSTEAFTFAVFGDWGQVDANGANPDQANLMRQLARSGARFVLSTGDTGYPSGSQTNYGDLYQTGPDTSAIFGSSFWPAVGRSIPMFSAIGNHGFARSDTVHPHFANWPADVAVATSGGRYEMTNYPSVNGSAPARYPSVWYAFDAGAARFYVLQATWSDRNAAPYNGTGSAYANDAAAHWTPASAQYQWLRNDLASHPTKLKFVVFHYPMYSDQGSEHSDTYLQASASLKGLLDSYGVNMAFTGHAHIYQRSVAGATVYYTTGGGGAKAQSIGPCAANTLYAIGWSYTRNLGTPCGAASAPSSAAWVYHYLKVGVSGSTVTVTPIDSTGRSFDVQTFTFSPTLRSMPLS